MENVKHENQFLGTEKIGKLLKTFALPCVLSLIIQALYNIVDQIFIGNCASLGSYGNGATGIIYPLTVIALAIGLCLGDGSAASLSINQGRGNTEKSHKAIGTALSVGAILSVILMVICFVFNGEIITFFCNGDQGILFDYSVEYSYFIIGGFFFFIMASIMNPIVRADGSPKFAMVAMAAGAVANIILDPVFIFGCNMGMTGAALATFLGQALTFALHVVYFFKTKTFKLSLKSFIPDFKLLWASVKMGVSSLLTQLSIVVISIVNTRLLFEYSAPYDSAITTAVVNIAFKVFGIIISIIIGISAGGQPILGYNYGAKKFDRVRKTFKLIMISSIIVGIVATLLFELCPQVIFQIFGNGGEGVDNAMYMEFATLTFRCYLSCILLTCITKATSIFFQAIGKPITSTLIAMLRDLIFLVPLVLVMTSNWGITGLLWSAPISDVLDMIVAGGCIIAFLSKLKREETNANYEKGDVEIKKSIAGTIITIEREHGAGGREIGKELALALNIPYYNKILTELTAEETGLSKEFVYKYEEGLSSRYKETFAGFEPAEQTIVAQNQILKKIADNGSAVIVGRAANHILRDYDLLRVFVYASEDYKVKRIMKNYNDDITSAQKNIEKADKKRAKFYEDMSGKKWNDYSNYDICLNGEVGVENAVEIILKAYKSKNKKAKR